MQFRNRKSALVFCTSAVNLNTQDSYMCKTDCVLWKKIELIQQPRFVLKAICEGVTIIKLLFSSLHVGLSLSLFVFKIGLQYIIGLL